MSNLHQELMDKAYDRWKDNGGSEKWPKEQFHDSLDPKECFACLEAGLTVKWDGSNHTRIWVGEK